MLKALMSFALALGVASSAVAAGTKTETATSLDTHSYNIRINPLSLLFGVINADFDIKLSPRFTFGPSLAFATRSSGTTKLTAFGVGVRGNVYLGNDAITDSWYLGPVAGMYFTKTTQGANEGSASAFNIGTVIGYNWVWPSGFNIMLGGGAQYISLPSSVTASNGTVITTPGLSGILPMLDFTLGYTF